MAETNGIPGPYDVALVSLLTARWRDRTSAAKAPPTYREDIEAALSQLDGEAQKLLRLRMEGLTQATIAGRLGVSPATMSLRMSTALGKLVQALRGGGKELASGDGAAKGQRGVTTGSEEGRPQGPPGLAEWERELWDAFDATRTKLQKLQGVRWRSLTVSRSSTDDRYDVRVTL